MNNQINIVKAYLDGMLLAKFGIAAFRDNVAEWQIEEAKIIR